MLYKSQLTFFLWKIVHTPTKATRLEHDPPWHQEILAQFPASEQKTKNENIFFKSQLAAKFTMGWLRWVGALRLEVSLAKEPYKRDDILQKRPVILRSLLIVANPYVYVWFYKSLLNLRCTIGRID